MNILINNYIVAYDFFLIFHFFRENKKQRKRESDEKRDD